MKVSEILLFTNPSRCMPCRMLDNALQSQSFEVPVKHITTGIGISEEDAKAQEKHGIKRIPTLVFVDSTGNELARLSGYSAESVKNIKNKIEELNS